MARQGQFLHAKTAQSPHGSSGRSFQKRSDVQEDAAPFGTHRRTKTGYGNSTTPPLEKVSGSSVSDDMRDRRFLLTVVSVAAAEVARPARADTRALRRMGQGDQFLIMNANSTIIRYMCTVLWL